jgi:muramidase (phage lysozyme)
VNAIVFGRIYPNGVAPQDTPKPYVVWQIVGGGPVNNLSEDPEMDDARVRVTTYTHESAGTAAAKTLAIAVRTALEAVTHVIFGPINDDEPETKSYRWIQDAEFWTDR